MMLFSRLMLLAALICSAPVLADTKMPDVSNELKQWVAAVQGGKPDAVVKLYDKDAIMFSTFAVKPMKSHAELTQYYKQALSNPDIKVDIVEEHPYVFGNVGLNSGLYNFHYRQDGEPVDIPARFTFTYLLKDGKWMIINHHSSRVPLADEGK